MYGIFGITSKNQNVREIDLFKSIQYLNYRGPDVTTILIDYFRL